MLIFFSYTLVEYESKHIMPKLLTKTMHEQKFFFKKLTWFDN